MRRPPPPVILVARAHWMVGAAIVVAMATLHAITRGLPIAFSSRSYLVAAILAGTFLTTGALVWCGAPGGQALTRLCSLFYLIRPRLCFQLWEIMRSAEFREHFAPRKPRA